MPPLRWALLPTLALIAFFTFFTYHYLPFSSDAVTPGITHIVMFKWKDSADQAAISDATSHLLSLKQKCTHPVHKTPYILSLTGGRDNSPEGLQDDLTHAFIVGFRTVWERDYYVHDDPDHKVFKDKVGDIVDKVVVMDFAPGRFD